MPIETTERAILEVTVTTTASAPDPDGDGEVTQEDALEAIPGQERYVGVRISKDDSDLILASGRNMVSGGWYGVRVIPLKAIIGETPVGTLTI